VNQTLKWSKNSQFQSFLLIGLFFFFVAHFLLLSPASLEEDFNGMRVIKPQDLLSFLKKEPETLAPETFFKTMTPNYSLRESVLYSTKDGSPGLKLTSRKVNLYQSQQMALLHDSVTELPDETRIESKEAVYDMSTGKVRFFGSVRTTFKSGAELFSEFALLETKPRLRISIPTTEKVYGKQTHLSSPVYFTSQGLEYTDEDPKLFHLLNSVIVNLKGARPVEILSDQVIFSHEEGILHFFMDDGQIIEKQFIRVSETGFQLRSRTLDLKLETGNQIEEIIALQDVWFKDTGIDHDTIGTGGKASYRVSKNHIVLTEFPQLYQDRDTIVGESITYHRNEDTVEVLESNAIYNSTKSNRKPKKAD
jgi:lipopolysaccharide export system protein LptA